MTFDDGPGPETPKVLEILRKYNARATFYQLGSQSVIWPEYSRQVVTEGHQLANHSWDHPNFARLSAAAQKVQLDRTSSQLAKVTGIRPCSFRPPGGLLGSRTGSIAAGRRLKTVLWTTDTNDWAAGKYPNKAGRKDLRRRARSGTRYDHPVLLLHDGGHFRPNMLAELPGILRWYQERGYRFVDMNGRSGVTRLSAAEQAKLVNHRRTPAGRTISMQAGRGRISVRGWVQDPDTRDKIKVRVQKDFRWIPATTTANKDISGVAGPRGAHEFELTFPASRGFHTVCTFGENVGAGARAGLGCGEVTVR